MNIVFLGNALRTCKELADDGIQVQSCITSPPYWGLRDYGTLGQIGKERTLDEYIQNLVMVFRDVRRMLKPDGTLWLNIGDSYCAGTTAMRKYDTQSNMKAKDLCGIPWLVAFALRADGWYLRQDIIWYKPNPMPESVRDRCTKAHEYIFLMSKNERYYYNADAIREPLAAASIARGKRFRDAKEKLGSPERDTSKHRKNGVDQSHASAGLASGRSKGYDLETGKRNKWSVWSVPTKPFKGAHFATFPPALIEPCIKAGSREGDVVFDPFFGSGTTGEVAHVLGRHWLGCEINSNYIQLQKERLEKVGSTFAVCKDFEN